MSTPKMLFVGDAVRQTGFERVSRAVLTELQQRGWEVHQLGINHNGDPGPKLPPWPVYPCIPGGDFLGIGRIGELHEKVKPDITVILGDSWVVPLYFQNLPQRAPVAAYIPVDSPNQKEAAQLQRLQLAIAYTMFGARELRKGGYQGKLAVIPHGIDADQFFPMDKTEARSALGMTEQQQRGFIVGSVNRNQIRKRLDAVMFHFDTWWKKNNRPDDAFLLLHCALQDVGWDLVDLARYLGILKQCIFTGAKSQTAFSPLHRLVQVYNALDVQVSCSLGEGWGLTTMEGMACGVPQIAARTGAMPEWARYGVLFVNCTEQQATISGINTLGGIIDGNGVVAAIDKFYRNQDWAREFGASGHNYVNQPEFTWRSVGDQFDQVLRRVIL